LIGRVHAYVAALLAGTSVLLMPQLVLADSGGAPLSGGSSQTTTSPASPLPNGAVQQGNRIITASGNGVTITTRAGALFRKHLRFSGHVSPTAAGHLIEIDRLGRGTHGAWTRTARGRIRSDGSFGAVWSTNQTGRFAIRAVVLRRSRPRALSQGSPTLTVIVYNVAIATTYGPGFYGTQTACGQKLTPKMLGTANRTLKCGTRVAILYHGRSIVVPVIDRGPYANGADWDLTVATAHKLGIDGTARIGAAPTR
jgi:rare lipoprotein A